MDPIIFDTELPVPLTENDPIDDDELSAFASGEYEIPLSHFQPPFTICPPVSCAIIPGSCVTEPDGNYGGEDPAEWEYFEDGPPSPRPTVQIPGGSTIPVYFPENED